MKRFALKSVTALMGVGLTGIAAAQVNLDGTTSDAFKFASETKIPSAGVTLGSTSAMSGRMVIGVAPASAYVRFDISKGTFAAEPSLSCTTNATTNSTAPSITATGIAYAVWSVSGASSTTSCTISNVKVVAKSQDTIALTGRVYETLTNAIAQADTTSLNTKSRNLATWAPAVDVAITPATTALTATVGSGYKSISGGNTNRPLGTVAVTLDTTVRKADGVAVSTVTEIIAESSTVVTGDFSFVGTRGVSLSGNQVAAADLSASKATFAGPTALVSGNNNLTVTAGGKNAIPAGSYKAAVTLTAASGFAVTSPAEATIGSIRRDGSQLLIPLAQSAGGYITRFSLVNRHTVDAPYTVEIIQEGGGTATVSGAAAGGTLKAGSTTVVDLTGVAQTNAFTGRGALLITIEAPNGTVRGTYQVTNISSGAVANQTMESVAQ